jgi:hypothetical protein
VAESVRRYRGELTYVKFLTAGRGRNSRPGEDVRGGAGTTGPVRQRRPKHLASLPERRVNDREHLRAVGRPGRTGRLPTGEGHQT